MSHDSLVSTVCPSRPLLIPQLCLGLAFSKSTPPVFAVRVLLGFFESVFGPCLLSITVQWYLKEEQPFAAATWQMMLGLASSIMATFGVSLHFTLFAHLSLLCLALL